MKSSGWTVPERFDFNGARVAWGKEGKGPAIIVVHGTPWSSFNLRHLVRGLKDRFTVYYYDLLGYGQSDKPDSDVSLGIQNILLAQLLDFWQLEKPLILGHDFGGTTVLRAHLLNGCRFRKIVLIDPVAVSPWGSPFFQHVRQHEDAFTGVPDYIHEAIVRAYINTAAWQEIDRYALDETVEPWLGRDGKAGFYRQIAQADARFTDEIESLFKTITVPVQILWGREDRWIPLEKGIALQRLIPGAILDVIENCGHLIIEEEPEKILAEVVPFLLKN